MSTEQGWAAARYGPAPFHVIREYDVNCLGNLSEDVVNLSLSS